MIVRKLWLRTRTRQLPPSTIIVAFNLPVIEQIFLWWGPLRRVDRRSGTNDSGPGACSIMLYHSTRVQLRE